MAPPNGNNNNDEYNNNNNNQAFFHTVWKREVSSSSVAGGGGGGIKAKLEEEVDLIADSTGLQTWQVVTFVSLITLGLFALIGWCVWRFFRKKRVGKDGADGKGGKSGPDVRDDENALVENEEEDAKLDADKKPETEYLGKLQYELKYDFNTQTLMVKVVQES